MTRPVFHPGARIEIEEARKWYENRAVGLGDRFVRAVDAAVTATLRTPNAHMRISGEARRVMVRRFPYSIVYVPVDGDLLIISCFHHKRRPDSWATRLNR